jgi:hypothetical protein
MLTCRPRHRREVIDRRGRRSRAGAVAQHRLAVRDEHPLDVEPRQRDQRRQEALLVPGAATLAVAMPRPYAQLPVDLEHGVAEGQGTVRWQLERDLGAPRSPDRVHAHAAFERLAAAQRAEGGAVVEPRSIETTRRATCRSPGTAPRP